MKAVLTFTISDVTPNIDITNHDHGADVSIQTQELYFNVNNSVKTDTAVIDFGSLYVKGDKGDIGPLGELGIQGIQGPKGDKGDKGDTGARGLTGPEGPVGPAGERGPIGPQGLQGPQGPVGERGPKGEKGDRGERGLQGLQGVQGERGEKGERGEQGAVGPVGPKGDRGEVGPVGPQGILGERGPQGERGELGIQGPIGPQGPAGDNVVIIETSVTETDGVTYVCSVEKSSTEIQQLIAQGKVCYWHVAEMNVYVLIDASWYTITGSSVDMDGQYYYIYIYRQQGNTLYGRVFQSVTLDDIPTIPTNVSEFTNDAGYLTEHLDISGKADDLSVVHLSGEETVLSKKTFSNGINVTADSNINGVVFTLSTTPLNTSNVYTCVKTNSSNPYFGLKQGSNLWYMLAYDSKFYFGPTSSKALYMDQNGNGGVTGTWKIGNKYAATTDLIPTVTNDFTNAYKSRLDALTDDYIKSLIENGNEEEY